MDNLPNGGKVVIVDDCFQEILPLINILNRNVIPVTYYTGKAGELPERSLQGVRLFFLDLRFSPNVDSKTIVSNACHILKAILGENNGPYLLIIWSSTGDEYKEELENELRDKLYRPEFILCLSKGDYFETKSSNVYSLSDDIKKILTDNAVDNVDYIMEKITERVIADGDEKEKIFVPQSMEKLQQELYNGLKKAGLLSFFVLWENTIRDSAHKVVNEIFSQIPDAIPVDKKLPAMAYYLAKNRLDKQFEEVEDKDKLYAALMELNELYVYFYSEDVIKISVERFLPINIQKNTDLVPSQAKFNSWKMISPKYKNDAPGNIYIDVEKTFEFFGLVNGYGDKEKYWEISSALKSDEKIIYVLMNINGECETAQNKYPVIRVIPGILIACESYKGYKEKNFLKEINRAQDYIFKEFEPIEYKGSEYYLLFNINQITFCSKENLKNMEICFRLHRKYYLKIRQSLSVDFSKQGIDLYSFKSK